MPELSKYFIDKHGILAFEQQMSLDVRVQFKVEGVFSWGGKNSQARDVQVLGFLIQKYRKFVKQ